MNADIRVESRKPPWPDEAAATREPVRRAIGLRTATLPATEPSGTRLPGLQPEADIGGAGLWAACRHNGAVRSSPGKSVLSFRRCGFPPGAAALDAAWPLTLTHRPAAGGP